MKLFIFLTFFSQCIFSQVLEIKNQSEVSMIKSGGNSNLESYNAKTQTTFSYFKYANTIGGHFFLSLSEEADDDGDFVNVESVRNWDVFFKSEKVLNKRYNLYAQIKFEGDIFSGYTQRDNYDIGFKYKVVEKENEKLSTELGYRYSIEHKTTVEENEPSIVPSNKGRWAISYERKQTNSLTYQVDLEYLPNFTNGSDYIVKMEPSMSVQLSNLFSLRLSYLSTYDNSPADISREKRDYRYTTSFIAKY